MRIPFVPVVTTAIIAAAACAVLLNAAAASASSLQASPHSSTQWEREISAFEKHDQASPPPKGAVVFVGSSSIRLWKDLGTTFLPKLVLNRGFGGSEIRDSTYFVSRIITPYQPRMVVLYAGDNDIAAGRTANETFNDFKEFAKAVRSQVPEAKIVFISIKPSPLRWKFVSIVEDANTQIKDFIHKQKHMVYIDVFHPMLGKDGQPRPEFYKEDKLHPTEACYALWRKIIGKYL